MFSYLMQTTLYIFDSIKYFIQDIIDRIFYYEFTNEKDYQNEIFYDCNSDTSDISSNFENEINNRCTFRNYNSIDYHYIDNDSDNDSISVFSSVSQLLHTSWMLRDV